MYTKLTKRQLTTALKTISADWKLDDSATHLVLSLPCKTYLLGFMMVTKIAIHAEVQKHYPTITLTHTKVKITLMTPTVKGISEADIRLAKQIDQLLLSTKR